MVAALTLRPDAVLAEPQAVEKDKPAPSPSGMQALFDLSVKRNKLQFELQVVERLLEKAEKEQFASFERIATPTGSDYWESISDNVVFAKATKEIAANELLLYHSPGIYRVKESKPKLTTKGECWYFRPDPEDRGRPGVHHRVDPRRPRRTREREAGICPTHRPSPRPRASLQDEDSPHAVGLKVLSAGLPPNRGLAPVRQESPSPRCPPRRSGGSRGRCSGRSASCGRGPAGAGSSRAGR